MLEIFYIILTNHWTIQNMCFNIVLHDTAGLLSLKLFDESENRFAATEDGWTNKTTTLSQCGRLAPCFFHHAVKLVYVAWITIRSCYILGKLLLQHMLDWVSYNNTGIFHLLGQHNSQMLMLAYYAQKYASIICKALLIELLYHNFS